MRHSRRFLLFVVLPTASALACGHGSGHKLADLNEPGEQVITEEAIAQSGANTAWEVLKATAPSMQFREDRNGNPSRMWRRGRSSVVLNDAPLVFLDGVKVSDFRMLDQIPARTIARISILNGIQGTTYYGTNAVGGVIRIETKNGSS
jgi:outer membrane cobalamin receptor